MHIYSQGGMLLERKIKVKIIEPVESMNYKGAHVAPSVANVKALKLSMQMVTTTTSTNKEGQEGIRKKKRI